MLAEMEVHDQVCSQLRQKKLEAALVITFALENVTIATDNMRSHVSGFPVEMEWLKADISVSYLEERERFTSRSRVRSGRSLLEARRMWGRGPSS